MEEDLGLCYSRHYVARFLVDSRIFRDQDPERIALQILFLPFQSIHRLILFTIIIN